MPMPLVRDTSNGFPIDQKDLKYSPSEEKELEVGCYTNIAVNAVSPKEKSECDTMEYVPPDFLFKDVHSSGTTQKKLLGLHIGAEYVTIAVSDNFLIQAFPLRPISLKLRMGSIAKVLQTRVKEHNVRGIIIGNGYDKHCILPASQDYDGEKAHSVDEFITELSRTGKFGGIKYTYWRDHWAFGMIKIMLEWSYTSEYVVQTLRVTSKVVVASILLQTYLGLMNRDLNQEATSSTNPFPQIGIGYLYKMKYVDPEVMFEDLVYKYESMPVLLLGLYIGTEYISFAVSDIFRYERTFYHSRVSVKFRIGLVARGLARLISQLNIKGIVIGSGDDKFSKSSCKMNNVDYDPIPPSEKAKRVMEFVERLAKTKKFNDIKYTYWKDHITYQSVKNVFDDYCLSESVRRELHGRVEVVAASFLLQNYLGVMHRYQPHNDSEREKVLKPSILVTLKELENVDNFSKPMGRTLFHEREPQCGQMKYVDPASFYEDIYCDLIRCDTFKVLGVFIGPEYFSITVTDGSPSCQIKFLRHIPVDTSMHDKIELLQQVFSEHTIIGILIGNMFDDHNTSFANNYARFGEKALLVDNFIQNLSSTEKFGDVNYTYWKEDLAYSMADSGNFLISSFRESSPKRMAFFLLETYREVMQRDFPLLSTCKQSLIEALNLQQKKGGGVKCSQVEVANSWNFQKSGEDYLTNPVPVKTQTIPVQVKVEKVSSPAENRSQFLEKVANCKKEHLRQKLRRSEAISKLLENIQQRKYVNNPVQVKVGKVSSRTANISQVLEKEYSANPVQVMVGKVSCQTANVSKVLEKDNLTNPVPLGCSWKKKKKFNPVQVKVGKVIRPAENTSIEESLYYPTQSFWGTLDA